MNKQIEAKNLIQILKAIDYEAIHYYKYSNTHNGIYILVKRIMANKVTDITRFSEIILGTSKSIEIINSYLNGEIDIEHLPSMLVDTSSNKFNLKTANADNKQEESRNYIFELDDTYLFVKNGDELLAKVLIEKIYKNKIPGLFIPDYFFTIMHEDYFTIELGSELLYFLSKNFKSVGIHYFAVMTCVVQEYYMYIATCKLNNIEYLKELTLLEREQHLKDSCGAEIDVFFLQKYTDYDMILFYSYVSATEIMIEIGFSYEKIIYRNPLFK